MKIGKIEYALLYLDLHEIKDIDIPYHRYLIEREVKLFKKSSEISFKRFIFERKKVYIPKEATVKVVGKNKFDIKIGTKYVITNDFNYLVTHATVDDGQFLHRDHIEEGLINGWIVLHSL